MEYMGKRKRIRRRVDPHTNLNCCFCGKRLQGMVTMNKETGETFCDTKCRQSSLDEDGEEG